MNPIMSATAQLEPSEYLRRAQPRVCTARRVSAFESQDVWGRLLAGREVQADFMLVDHLAAPTAESSFDVCCDERDLYVSVLLWEAGAFGTAPPAAEGPGAGPNVVELLVGPWGDGVGYLQFGAGPGVERWFSAHWPYRDGRPDLSAGPRWGVRWDAQVFGIEVARRGVFRLPLSHVVADRRRPVGLNVMRTQLRTAENATWSHAAGAGFPDAGSAGWLLLDETPAPPPVAWHVPRRVERRRPRLFVTYDFPDEALNAPYSPQAVADEFRTWRDHGCSRIYWIDQPDFIAHALAADRGFHRRPLGADQRGCLEAAHEAFGGDPLATGVQIAHDLGLEFYTIAKPYDLQPDGLADPRAGELPGHWRDWTFRRNPSWQAPVEGPLKRLVLYGDGTRPADFDPRRIEVWASPDNRAYRRVEPDSVAAGPLASPTDWPRPGAGPAVGSPAEVWGVRIALDLQDRYIALRLPDADASDSSAAASDGWLQWPVHCGNQRFRLVQAFSEAGALPVSIATQARPNSLTEGFGFDSLHNAAWWSPVSEWIAQRQELAPGMWLALRIGSPLHAPAMFDPGWPEVRQWWCRRWVRRAIDAGADGVDIRIAHHIGLDDFSEYMFAEPLLAEFRRRTGREPRPDGDDLQAMRRIRGEMHTAFIREAGELLRAAGRKIEHHVEARMAVGPAGDCYTGIHWDVAGWIEQGLLDAVNLKYLGPFNPWVHREVLPRARAAGLGVHVIHAGVDPRVHPRSAEAHRQMLEMVHAADLDALNLYEAWVFLRHLPPDTCLFRGGARSVLDGLRRGLDDAQGRPRP